MFNRGNSEFTCTAYYHGYRAICVVLLQYNKHFLPTDHLSKVF